MVHVPKMASGAC